MTALFQHQPLDRSRREIRLLKLLPKAQWVNDSLPTCSISHATIDHCPPYLALSYVWGDKHNQRQIIIDGCTFEVTKNLFEALIGITGSETIIIWIDAICINQADDEEKGWQVALMGDIYRNTSEVIAWLGPAANNSDKVMDHMDVLGSIAQACDILASIQPCETLWKKIWAAWPNAWKPSEFTSNLKTWPTHIHGLEILFHAIGGLKHHKYLIKPADLGHLFRRPWWGRIWVLQEISLPKQAHFVCGTKRISRQRFHAAFEAYRALWSAMGSGLRGDRSCSVYHKQLILMNLSRVHLMLSTTDIYQTKDFALAEMLRATNNEEPEYRAKWGRSSLDATDPRDKIFALLNIVNDKEELESFGVYPDYTKSKEEIYTITMIAMLRQGYISLLSQACGVTQPHHLASWVPDWSIRGLRTLQRFGRNYMNPEPRFHACGLKKKIHIVFKNHKPIPMIEGTVCDQIFRSGHVNRIPGFSEYAHPAEWLRVIKKFVCLAKELYPGSKMCLETAARVLHTGMKLNTSGLMEREDYFPKTIDFLKKVSVWGENSDEFLKLQETIRQSLSGLPANGTPTDVSLVVVDLLEISDGRTIFITRKGRLGICSMEAKEGDVVALISGAQTPFVLRPVNGRRRIVSEAYVDGIMDGEAAEEAPWDWIELE